MWSEINDILDAVLRNEVEKILRLIAVRVKESKTFAIMNILYHQIMEEGSLANAGFPTDVHMPRHVGLYRSPVDEVGANSSHALGSFSYVAGKCRQGYKNNDVTAFYYTPSSGEGKCIKPHCLAL